MSRLLRELPIAAIRPRRGGGIDEATIEQARAIVRDVRAGGEAALRRRAVEFGDIRSVDAPILFHRADLMAALAETSPNDGEVLQRTAARIRAFAVAQRASISPVAFATAVGMAEQRILPVDVAGCYAPGGRFPLPSSVLMTAVTARAAGVTSIIVASPKPTPITLAAAAIADADCVLAVGGAQAIGALAYGIAVPPCDVIAGPGNRWVTAAKHVVSIDVRIDMLAGPSELVVVADDSADPAIVAADLLAQAEHDRDALPVLIAMDRSLPGRVNDELERQLSDLPTAEVARASLRDGYSVVARSLDEAATLCDDLAPEHLQLSIRNPAAFVDRVRHFGALFVGESSAEVLGDYGAGPNHVLPTGGSARATGGLSVFNFLRFPTVLGGKCPDAVARRDMVKDAIALARFEGLEAHARAAESRL